MRHPHRLQPCTRGFQPAVSCSRTRTLWIRFTTASRGGKPAEHARADVQPQPRRSKQPWQPYPAWHGRVCEMLQPTWCRRCYSGCSELDCTALDAAHLAGEKNLRCTPSRQSGRSKIHGWTPLRNSAAAETLLRAARAPASHKTGIARVAQSHLSRRKRVRCNALLRSPIRKRCIHLETK